MASSQTRLEALLNHLNDSNLSSFPCAAEAFPVAKMGALLNGSDQTYRDEAFAMMKNNPLFRLDYNLPKESLRHLTKARVFALLHHKFIKSEITAEERNKYQQYGEALSYHDSSMNTLVGAQMVLFAGSILKLGTEYHYDSFFMKAQGGLLRGCFALTELGHGSNVRGIETTATYDKARDEFVIHTPTETAQKYWIGGAADWAQWSTVFAQLYIDGVHYGVHAFLVPVRDENDNPLPGVKIKECGHKMGLNGVDNGRFWFDQVRIPRVNLLDRYGSVSKGGEYSSMISNNDARFAVTMGNLLDGRISISIGSTNICKIALATAIPYGHTRRQFGPPGKEEIPIIDYVSHHVRLMPLLANAYANHFISKKAQRDYIKAQEATDFEAIKEAHVLISGLKSLCSWNQSETLQTCREACGGQGYKSSNRIGILKADGDIQLTYEGDNAVMLQQVSKDLIKGQPTTNVSLLKNDLEIKNKIDSEYLNCPKVQLKIFQLREADLVAQLKGDFEAAKKRGLSSEQAFQSCATIATEAGRAHIETETLLEFIQREENEDPSLLSALQKLRSLYTLTRFDSSPSFLREQYFSVEKQKAIHSEFVKVCGEVKHISLSLVESFQIPSFLLGDIAGDWVEKNSYAHESLL